MKKLFFVFAVLVGLGLWFFVKATQAVPVDEILDDRIYVFVQKGCPHCWAAEEYLKNKYAHLDLRILDIAESKNRQMFFGCGAKFGISKMKMGTPLFCMGQHYILGWDRNSEKQFDSYVQDFEEKTP